MALPIEKEEPLKAQEKVVIKRRNIKKGKDLEFRGGVMAVSLSTVGDSREFRGLFHRAELMGNYYQVENYRVTREKHWAFCYHPRGGRSQQLLLPGSILQEVNSGLEVMAVRCGSFPLLELFQRVYEIKDIDDAINAMAKALELKSCSSLITGYRERSWFRKLPPKHYQMNWAVSMLEHPTISAKGAFYYV